MFASHIDVLGRWYNKAAVLVERNYHGHALLLWLRDHSALSWIPGHDGRPGQLSNSKGKALLYDAVADAFRERQTVLHSFATFAQLALIKGGTLRAPEGEHDDRADSYALACLACQLPQYEAYTGPLCYSTPWPPDQDPAAHTTSSLPLLLEDLRIDLEGDWDPGLAAWR